MKKGITAKIALMVFLGLMCAGGALAQAGRGKARLSGVVLDPNDKPVPAAKVTVAFTKEAGVKFEATTNKKGEWGIIGLGTGDWVVGVSAKGFAPAAVKVYVSQLAAKVDKVVVKLEPEVKQTGSIQDETAFALLEEGNQYYKEGKYDAALALYAQFMEKNTAAYQVLLNVGDCYREKGDYETAMKNYNVLMEKAKEDTVMGKDMTAKGAAAIGLLYLRQENLGEAQKFFKQSLEASPKDESLAYNVGEIYFSNQKIDDAQTYFELAAKIKPEWPEPYLKLGYVFLNKGDTAKAVEYFDKFLNLEPDTDRSAQVRNIVDSIKK